MKIESKIHSLYFIRPITLFLFFIFFTLLICLSLSEFKALLLIFLISSSFTLGLSYLLINRQYKICINDTTILCKAKFPNRETTYLLSDITDFKWRGTPFLAFRMRNGRSQYISNDQFELTFSNGETLHIMIDQYSNFNELRKFFYSYCIKNKIIEMRTLEERKKSRFKK